jgi:hypothetical protein
VQLRLDAEAEKALYQGNLTWDDESFEKAVHGSYLTFFCRVNQSA